MGGAAVPLAIGGAGLSALGNVKGANTNVATPPDLQGPRSQQINILDYLLGGQQGSQGGAGDPTGPGSTMRMATSGTTSSQNPPCSWKVSHGWSKESRSTGSRRCAPRKTRPAAIDGF